MLIFFDIKKNNAKNIKLFVLKIIQSIFSNHFKFENLKIKLLNALKIHIYLIAMIIYNHYYW
jgi:hypothetical protein